MSYTQFTRGRGASVVCNLQRKGKLWKQRPMANLISQVKHGVKTAPTHASTHGVAFQRSDLFPNRNVHKIAIPQRGMPTDS